MRRVAAGSVLLAALLLVGACASARTGLTVSPETPDAVAASLRRMPADSSRREGEIAADLLATPETVPVLVSMLGATTHSDDAAARFGLETLVRWVTRPGADEERSRLAAALAHELERQHPTEAVRFVLSQLERLADPQVVPRLALLLGDERLGDAVARALVGIGGTEATAAVVVALRESAPGSRLDLLAAAGRLGADEALPELRAALSAGDPTARRAAARALADLAAPGVGEDLLAAARASSDLERRDLAAEALRYSVHAADGRSGVEVAEALFRMGRETDDQVLQAAALGALGDVSDAAARRALAAVPEDAAPRLRARATALREELDARERAMEILEHERRQGFAALFNGSDLTGWVGATDGYYVQNGAIVCDPDGGGNLYTENEYDDFVLRFEFRLTPGANNGLGIRAPLEGDAAYVGMELQILDNTARRYTDLQPYQYHGSIYGVSPAERGHQRPVGEWNEQEVIADGRRIRVVLNGATVLDVDLDEVSTPETADGRPHPGLARETGHIGFLGHGHRVELRKLRIREIRVKQVIEEVALAARDTD